MWRISITSHSFPLLSSSTLQLHLSCTVDWELTTVAFIRYQTGENWVKQEGINCTCQNKRFVIFCWKAFQSVLLCPNEQGRRRLLRKPTSTQSQAELKSLDLINFLPPETLRHSVHMQSREKWHDLLGKNIKVPFTLFPYHHFTMSSFMRGQSLKWAVKGDVVWRLLRVMLPVRYELLMTRERPRPSEWVAFVGVHETLPENGCN